MDIPLFLSQLGHLAAMLAFGWLVLTAYRWIQGRSKIVGAIVAITIVGRIAIGLTLFSISYFSLPIGSSLQIAGGFWQIAPDATGYYQMAATVVGGSLHALDHTVPSPVFVDALGLWMSVVGLSPAAGIFLNLCLYVGLISMMVWFFLPVDDWRSDLPCIVGVAAYSFSPVVVFHSTQPLKDELSCVLSAMLCFGVLATSRLIYSSRAAWNWGSIGMGVFAVGLATFGTAGIRWYNAVVFLGTLGLLLAAFTVRTPLAGLPRYVVGSCALLLAAWIGFWGGAGPFYELVGANIALKRIAAIPFDLATIAQVSRTGFLTSGGNTNIVVPLRQDAALGQARERELQADQHRTAASQARLLRSKSPRLVSYSNFPPIGLLAPVSLQAMPEPNILRTAQAAAGVVYLEDSIQSLAEDASTTAVQLPEAPTLKAFPEPHIPAAPQDTPRVVTINDSPAPAAPLALRGVPITIRDQFRTGALGLAIVFVPLSVLEPMLGLNIVGEPAALAVADLDTVFVEITTVLVLSLLWTRRRAIGDRLPFVVFALMLSATSAVLLGYVVTNYGTLWRLRSAVVVPLWVAVVALSPESRKSRASINAAEPIAVDS